MKNRMSKILLFLLVLALSVCLICACNETKQPTDGSSPTTVPVTAEVSKHTDKYFVGEKLDVSNGNVKFTREDGTSFTRKLNDTKIQINYTDADFQTAGTKTLTFVYEQDGTQFSGSFTVEVYEIASVILSVPTKTTYRNYEEALNLKGGGIRLSNADGSFSRTIELDNEAVSLEGYAPTLATEEHRTEPLVQEITVRFGTVEPQKFEVKVLYTDVLKVNQFAEDIAYIDWTSETDIPTISEQLGQEVMDMMLTYANMRASDRQAVADENVLQLSRTALAYAYDLWHTEFMTYDGAFTDDPDNGFTYTFTSYNALKDEVARLKNTDSRLYQIGEVVESVLRNSVIQTEEMGFALVYYLSNKAWGDQITVAEYKEVMDAYGQDVFQFAGFYGWFTFVENTTLQETVLPLFDFMLGLQENMAGIDHDFDFSTTEHNDQARTTIDLILSEDNLYNYEEYAQIYEIVDSWLGGKGFFNLLYTYIYKYEPENITKLNALAQFILPVELQELNRSLDECLSLAELFANDVQTAIDNSALQIDTTDFLKNYYCAQEINSALKVFAAGTKEYYFYTNIKKDIGEGTLCSFDELLENVRCMAGGYYSLLGGGVNNQTVEGWLKTFIDTLYSEGQNGGVIAELLHDYARMSVADQASVVSALYAYYDSGLSTFAFRDILQKDVYFVMGYTQEELDSWYQNGYISKEDYDSLNDVTSASHFLKLVTDYYRGQLQNEQTAAALQNLLRAMDEYLNYGAQNGASNTYEQDQFKKTFAAIKEGLTDPAALAEFNEHFGEIYTIYEKRLQINTTGSMADFGEYQPLVDELITALEYSLTGIGYTYDYVSSTIVLIPHEKAEALLKELLSKIGDNEEYMYLYKNYACFKFNESVMYPLEYVVNFSRSYYNDYVLSLGDSYTPALRNFLASCYDTVVACFYEGQDAAGTPTFNDFVGLYDTALAWVNLTDEEFLTFFMLDLDYTAFYQYTLNYAMTALDTRLTIPVKELAKQLFYIVDSSDEENVVLPENLIASYITVLSGITMDISTMTEYDLTNYYGGLEKAIKDLQAQIEQVKADISAFNDVDKAAFALIEDICHTLIERCERAVESAEAILSQAA